MVTATLFLLLSLIPLSLLPLSSPLPPSSVLNAAEILSNSGYVSMSLTLQLISPSLTTSTSTPTSPSSPSPPRVATIFSPSDAAFAASGQPPLSLLHLHFSPLALSFETLRSLPYATRIPTMSPAPASSLFITTPDPAHPVSLNNVTITGSPLYDDGSLIIFGVDAFFDPHFLLPPRNQVPIPSFGCLASQTPPTPSFRSHSFTEASRVLRSREYSVMASCLDLQLLGLLRQPNLTVFAPVDDALVNSASNFSDYVSIFRRHVVPCRLTSTDLSGLGEGAVLRTFDDGFGVGVAKVNGESVVNGVPVTFPDMYSSDWLVVHGLRRVIGAVQQTSPEYGGVERSRLDRNEF